MILNEFFNLPQVFEKETDEGIFGSRPSPVLPVVDKIAKVASGLTPQNVETGKQIIQANARDITRMLSPQSRSGVDVIEQGVAEDSTAHDCKHCNGKGYHTVTKKDGTKVATNCPQCKGKGYIVTKGMAEGTDPALSNLTPSEIKGIGMMIQAGHDIPTIIRIFDNKPTAQQITAIATANMQQGMAEGTDDYVPPKEANYDDKYQAMVRRVGEKARAQEKAKQQPKTPVRESRRELLKQIIQS